MAYGWRRRRPGPWAKIQYVQPPYSESGYDGWSIPGGMKHEEFLKDVPLDSSPTILSVFSLLSF